MLVAKRKQLVLSEVFHRLRGTLHHRNAAHYPQSELRWVDASHYIQREKPEAVFDAMDAYSIG